MRAFRYCADRVFLVAGCIYVANRLWLAPQWGTAVPFLKQYLGDFLLVPCALPLLLWGQRMLGLRTHDRPPTLGEIFSTLILWSVLFEWLFPRVLGRGVSDPGDVVAYAAGAIIAGLAWNRGADFTLRKSLASAETQATCTRSSARLSTRAQPAAHA